MCSRQRFFHAPWLIGCALSDRAAVADRGRSPIFCRRYLIFAAIVNATAGVVASSLTRRVPGCYTFENLEEALLLAKTGARCRSNPYRWRMREYAEG